MFWYTLKFLCLFWLYLTHQLCLKHLFRIYKWHFVRFLLFRGTELHTKLAPVIPLNPPAPYGRASKIQSNILHYVRYMFDLYSHDTIYRGTRSEFRLANIALHCYNVNIIWKSNGVPSSLKRNEVNE